MNVGTATCAILDIGEELGVMAHFIGESMGHMDENLFPPRKRSWFRRLSHRIARFFLLRKVRKRSGDRSSPLCHVAGKAPPPHLIGHELELFESREIDFWLSGARKQEPVPGDSKRSER